MHDAQRGEEDEGRGQGYQLMAEIVSQQTSDSSRNPDVLSAEVEIATGIRYMTYGRAENKWQSTRWL